MNAPAPSPPDEHRRLQQLLEEWAAPDAELGWVGAPQVADQAEELAGFLLDRGVTL